MPTYTSTADIYNVLSQKHVAELTDDTAGNTPDDDKIDSALNRAESVVDSYVGKQYDVPLDTPVPQSIAHAVLVLARCYLYSRRPGATPDEIAEACEETIEWLKMIAAGTLEVDDIDAASVIADEDNDDQVFVKQVF